MELWEEERIAWGERGREAIGWEGLAWRGMAWRGGSLELNVFAVGL